MNLTSKAISIMVLLVYVAALALTGAAQEKPAPTRQKSVEKPNPTLPHEIFYLKHSVAEETAEILQNMFGDTAAKQIHVVPNKRLNALIVQATAPDRRIVAQVLETLDREPPPKERQIKVFQLAHIEPDERLLDTLSIVVDQGADIATDPARKAIIAAGAPHSLQVIESLLMRLDRPLEPSSTNTDDQSFQVRVVWLVQGLEDGLAAKTPADLKKVVEELSKIGVGEVKMAAQIVVNTALDHVFTTSGSAKLDKPCQLELTGAVSHSGKIELFASQGRSTSFRRGAAQSPSTQQIEFRTVSKASPPKLQLNITAMDEGGKSPRCQLQTTIKTPLGQTLVLGVTPMDSLTSVFVVQIRRHDAKPAQPRASPMPRY